MNGGVFVPPAARAVKKKRLDDRYEVGNDGLIYSGGGAMVAIGGVGVNIHGERKKVAYLVARAWVPNPECRPFVRHINGDITDNRPENLEWCEKEEKLRRGPKPQTRWCSCYATDGTRLGTFRSPSEGAVAMGVDARHVRKCLYGLQKTAGGYLWSWGL